MSELVNEQGKATAPAEAESESSAATGGSSSGSNNKETTHGVGDRTKYYQKWDEFAAESDKALTAEEEAAKAAAEEAKKGPLNEQHKRDLEKREALKEAKKQWDGVKANEENMKIIIENETGDSADECRRLHYEKDLQQRRVVILRNNKNTSYELAADIHLTKVFIEHCEGILLFLDAKVNTSTVEISHCKGLTLIIGGGGHAIHTVQVDESSDVRVSYHMGVLQAEQSKLFHCGVRGLTVEHSYAAPAAGAGGSGGGNRNGRDRVAPVVHERSQHLDDYELAAMVPAPTPAAAAATATPTVSASRHQFVTTLNTAGELVTDLVLRDARGHITTAREVQARKDRVRREAAARGLDEASIELLVSECDAASHKQRAEAVKEEGNKAFKACDYGQAALHYTQAVELLLQDIGSDDNNSPSITIIKQSYPDIANLLCALYSNRAACSLKLGDHANALADADRCLEFDPEHVKSTFRKGLALHALGRHREACPVLGKALKHNPNDKQIKAALVFAERKAMMEAQGGRR